MNGVYRDLTKTLHHRLTSSRAALSPSQIALQSRRKLTDYRRQALERKVRRRTDNLEKIQIEAMRELNRYAEFGRISSSLIHELVNPLTAMAMQIDELDAAEHPELAKELKEAVAAMEGYITHARRQLRHQSLVQSFNVASEVEATVRLLGPKAEAAKTKVFLNLDTDLYLTGDTVRFDQIISNLLANAIDAAGARQEAGKRTIKIDARMQANEIVISVRDNGHGIPSSVMSHIFAPFFTTKTSERGTGLGLTITKQSIEDDFNGVIEVANCFPQGAEFIIRIPRSSCQT